LVPSAASSDQKYTSNYLPNFHQPTQIVEGRLYRIGQIGTFVRIPVGFLNLYGIVSSVGTATRVDANEDLGDTGTPDAIRTVEIQLVGEAYGAAFQRGLSEYPTLDDEVHAVTEDDVASIYRSTAHAQISIGSHSASENLAAYLDLDRFVTRHTAVVGSTGSGKSNTVAAILKALTKGDYPSARIFVIDPHGEYGAAFPGLSKVFRIGATTDSLVIPYWALSFDELAWFLVDRKGASESPQDSTLSDRVLEIRQQNAPIAKASLQQKLTADDITVDSPIGFSLRELWYYFDRKERQTFSDMTRTKEELIEEGDPLTLRSAKFRPPGAGAAAPFKASPPPIMGVYVTKILARLRDRRFDFLLNVRDYDGVQKDLDDLVREWSEHDQNITIFDLAGAPSEVIDLVVGLITRILFETLFWGRDLPGVGKDRPLLMVFEEAHQYLPSGEARFIQGYARRAVQRVLKEGRKYGFGALVVSQRPAEVDETILSQCGTFIA
jgi:DNA helicase HerA-like ATPase